MSSSLNIILFGETGVGKSSVINLIAGRSIAETSPDVQGCTMSFKPYSFNVGNRTFHIWDTVGLEEPEFGNNGYLPAIEQACDLIHQLSNRGGVDLLLFCIRGNRVTATTQSNYRLFYEVLCRESVPIALVITHLEREPDMEGWWMRNMESLEKYGIKAAGHACVTGLPTHSKYRESKLNIHQLLEGHTSDGRFNMPPEGWLIEFLRMFGLFAPLKKDSKRKDILKVLTKRCKLHPDIADELASKLEGVL
ncbi:P-loop containing nucleoside triphosphate hydrolase protein [Tylopilus felleus]|jgi:tRNA U34 5-carboxymethylaminomethyl modifying GTPase MnmE/TrmE